MPVVFDHTTVYQVQQANDIVDVITEHVSLKKKGREMVGLCPFHDDHRPSMNVNPAKQIFKCFACGAGGDVFKFLQMRENLTFPQAIERLAERAGIKLERRKTTKSDPGTPGPDTKSDLDPNRLAKVNAWAAEHFHKNLNDRTKGKYARDYLAERQITPQSAEKWRLGLALNSQDDLIRSAGAKRIPSKLLEQAGLVTGLNQDKFINRLMFPITDVTGRVIGFGGRTLDNAPAKYINSPTTVLFDKSNCLYGLEQARHQIVSSATAVVVEGYTDCIAAHQLECTNVVATLGTSLTAGHGRILRRYAKKVILVFDSDVAGIEAANRALDVCLSQHIDIRIASVPEGKDPCDFILAAGKDPFEKLLADAVDVLSFKWDRLKEKFADDDTIAGRKAAVEEYLQAIALGLSTGNISPIDTGIIINRISAIIGLDKKQINRELNIRIARAARAASYNVENQRAAAIDLGQGLFAAAQREILEILLNEPKLFESAKSKIKPDDFDVPLLKQTAQILFEMLSTKTHISLEEVLTRAESTDLGNCITQLAQAGDQKRKFESRLTAAIDVFAKQLARRDTPPATAEKDQKKFLKRAYENARKENPHSIGMT